MLIHLRTIDNRPYGSFSIYEVISFVRHPVGKSIARPIFPFIPSVANAPAPLNYIIRGAFCSLKQRFVLNIKPPLLKGAGVRWTPLRQSAEAPTEPAGETGDRLRWRDSTIITQTSTRFSVFHPQSDFITK